MNVVQNTDFDFANRYVNKRICLIDKHRSLLKFLFNVHLNGRV